MLLLFKYLWYMYGILSYFIIITIIIIWNKYILNISKDSRHKKTYSKVIQGSLSFFFTGFNWFKFSVGPNEEPEGKHS